MARASNLTMCSFCGKSHAEVRKLIAGPGVYICDSCINVCKSILDKELNEDARRQSSNIRVPKPAEIRRAVGRYRRGTIAPPTPETPDRVRLPAHWAVALARGRETCHGMNLPPIEMAVTQNLRLRFGVLA